MTYSLDFAISFSGVDRQIAKDLTKRLVAYGAKVFYDNSYRSYLWGKRLDRTFPLTFGSEVHFFVPIVSASYIESEWAQYEWSIAKREAERRDEEFILPLRLDDSLLPGLPDTIGYLDLRNVSLDETADCLMDKLTGTITPRADEPRVRDWVVTFGVLMEDLEEEPLPPEAPYDYASLCDWLIAELMNRLKETSLRNPRFLEDARSGETLSVRISFEWNPAEGPLDFGELEWWDLLELLPYDEVYSE